MCNDHIVFKVGPCWPVHTWTLHIWTGDEYMLGIGQPLGQIAGWRLVPPYGTYYKFNIDHLRQTYPDNNSNKPLSVRPPKHSSIHTCGTSLYRNFLRRCVVAPPFSSVHSLGVFVFCLCFISQFPVMSLPSNYPSLEIQSPIQHPFATE